MKTRIVSLGLLINSLILLSALESFAVENKLEKVPKGQYELFYRDDKQDPGTKVTIPDLLVQKYPVTNKEFLEFVQKNPDYSKSKMPRIMASENYLAHWKTDFEFDEKLKNLPVVNVSWFAARAYCESQGLRLLTVNEWEYSSTVDKKTTSIVLEWYQKPNKLHSAHEGISNKYGLTNMHGLIWEWVSDYSSVIIKADSRGTNDRERGLFCGAGSLGSADPELYSNYMRFAFRSSLKANYVTSNLGFRCAKDGEGK